MNLYQLDKTINDIIEKSFSVDEETGEILFDESDLEKLNNDKNNKIEGIAVYVKNLLGEAEMIKAEEKRLAERRKAKENKAENLKKYLQGYLDIVQCDKFESSRASITFRKSESVVVEDVYKIPEDYLRYKEPEANKTEIKKAIKAGKLIEGAHLETNRSMTIK